MSTPSKEQKWDRYDLEQRGFYYNDDSRPPMKPFPRHVEALQQAMLDFTCEKDYDRKLIVKIEDSAMYLYETKSPEPAWKDFFRENFFRPLLDDVSVSQEDSRRVSRANYYYDTVISESEDLWVTFDGKGRLGDSLPDLFYNKKRPQPDRAFYFPIYHLTEESHVPRIADREALKWHKASMPALVESFSWPDLKRLYAHGLRPSPFHAFDKRKPLEKHLKCFPWLVIEHKKMPETGEKLKEVAYCQAVNGSGCAVRLNQIAAKYTPELARQAHVPPIPAVTTVGPEVKVWITYYIKDFFPYFDDEYDEQQFRRHDSAYMMQCIWDGDMTEPEDIVKFRLILENIHTWATRVFKPLITTYIDQWRFVHSPSSQQRMELSRSALRFVQRALDGQPDPEDDDLDQDANMRLMELCDTFVQAAHQIMDEKLERLRLKNLQDSSFKLSRRRTRAASEQPPQTMSCLSPDVALSPPHTDPRGSPRFRTRSVSRPCTPSSPTPGARSRVQQVASPLQIAMATAAARGAKRRESGSNSLESPPEIVPQLILTPEGAADCKVLDDSPSIESSSIDTPADEIYGEILMPGAFPPVTPAKSVQSSVSDIVPNEDGVVSSHFQNLSKGFANMFLGRTP
ncbi:hypothetical protein FOMG_15613 [Fusarium oxysporum f. sp. melonis 26406]|uniref:Uncharacterized protein n=3 Tax=Fusarium oxysporum f. sp. melonis 26406 TaxID=1089452 RepID=W9ZHY2_FUSOX|nr:hypothetical protein FOMG_15613 [Fusarium oxysporum f. sp. melonis 26406]KAJ9420047.1 hypothetical protein QL093DRAFT_2325202 [Fusarium oxysporum]